MNKLVALLIDLCRKLDDGVSEKENKQQIDDLIETGTSNGSVPECIFHILEALLENKTIQNTSFEEGKNSEYWNFFAHLKEILPGVEWEAGQYWYFRFRKLSLELFVRKNNTYEIKALEQNKEKLVHLVLGLCNLLNGQASPEEDENEIRLIVEKYIHTDYAPNWILDTFQGLENQEIIGQISYVSSDKVDEISLFTELQNFFNDTEYERDNFKVSIYFHKIEMQIHVSRNNKYTSGCMVQGLNQHQIIIKTINDLMLDKGWALKEKAAYSTTFQHPELGSLEVQTASWHQKGAHYADDEPSIIINLTLPGNILKTDGFNFFGTSTKEEYLKLLMESLNRLELV